nr:unnamed protein product [Callosobruchus analis]
MSEFNIGLNILENYENIKPIECSEFGELNKLLVNSLGSRTHFTVLHYNIRSLQAHFDEFCVNIAELNIHDNIGDMNMDIVKDTEHNN